MMVAGQLYEDLVFEVILRLPLKYAIQCKSLNKSFYDSISHPTFTHKHALTSPINNTTLFHCSFPHPKIFTKVDPKNTHMAPTTSRHLPFEVSILASCNGVFLLQLEDKNEYIYPQYVFNPITGQSLEVHRPYRIYDHNAGPAGLAVDLGNNKFFDHPFKVVMLKKEEEKEDVLTFYVVVPTIRCGRPCTTLKYLVDFVSNGFSFFALKHKSSQPVYANGALHWLGKDGTNILAFDVGKDEVKLINGPTDDGILFSSMWSDMWFGLAQGSLSFVINLKEEILIYAHNHVNDVWQIRHRIEHISSTCGVWPVGHMIGYISYYEKYVKSNVFFDGERLILQPPKKGQDGEIYVHEISSKRWTKIGVMEYWRDPNQHFVPFLPTLAKVIDDDDDDVFVIGYKRIKDSLLQLQEFIRHP